MEHENCRGCGLRPHSLDKTVGYCYDCREIRDKFANNAMLAILIEYAGASYEMMDDIAKRSFKMADMMMVKRRTR